MKGGEGGGKRGSHVQPVTITHMPKGEVERRFGNSFRNINTLPRRDKGKERGKRKKEKGLRQRPHHLL